MQDKKIMKKEDLIKFIDNFPGGVILCDVKGNIIILNNTLAKILNKPREDLIGRNGFDFLEKHVGESRIGEIQKMLITKKPVTFIDYERGVWWKTTIIPVKNNKGEIEEIACFFQEITDEMKIEKDKLVQLEAYYITLIENSMDLITVIDQNSKILFVSTSIEKILGYKIKERIGRSFFENIHLDDIDFVKNFFNKIIKKPGTTDLINFRVKDNKGKWHYIEAIGNNQLHNEYINGIIINSRDVTDKEIIKQQLVSKDNFYSALTEHSLDLFSVIDTEGKVVYHSPSVINVLGYKPEDRIGLKGFQNVHPDDLNIVMNEFKNAVIIPGYSASVIFRMKNNKGEYRFFESRVNSQLNNPNVNGIIVNTRDITESEKSKHIIKETMNYLDNIIKNTNEIIFTINKDFKINLWNNKAVKITGYKNKNVMGKNIENLNFIENKKEFIKYINDSFNGKKQFIKNIIIKSKYGSNKVLSVSPSFLKNQDGMITDIVFICNDITMRDISLENLPFGNCFFNADEVSDNLIELFNSITKKNDKGLYITRSNIDEINNKIDEKNSKILFLTSKKGNQAINSINDLKTNIEEFILNQKRGIIALDRIDFLINMDGFSEFMKIMYKINDIIRKHNAILIIRINNKILDDYQYSILLEEFNELPYNKTQDLNLDKINFKVLEFVSLENKTNINVTQTTICKHLQISKVTAQKRIEELIDKKLIISKSEGRTKNIYITKMGNNLLNYPQ
jgi:PAS domain S-box-containing protein